MNRIASRTAIAGLLAFFGGVASAQKVAPAPNPSSWLFVWAGEMNVAARSGQANGARRGTAFLAVLDAAPQSSRYGQLIKMLPVGVPARMPHHTHYEMPANGLLFANDFEAGKTQVFDLSDPLRPKVKTSFGDAGPYTHAHSFVSLPNGNTLATFQQKGSDDSAPGALVEIDPQGRVVRTSDASDPRVHDFVRPYSLAVVPSLDRVVTGSADMLDGKGVSHAIQVWRLSDLKLLKTVVLPTAGMDPVAAEDPSEPRVLSDGRTVLVTTFNCGLFRVDGLDGPDPSASPVYDFGTRLCGIPIVAGRFWVAALQSNHSIVSLDVSDPAHPIEAGRLVLGPHDLPHWLSLEPDGDRIVITGMGALSHRLLIAKLNMQTGKLSLDESFREPGSKELGFSFDRHWPDSWNGPAIPHGAVFSLPEKIPQLLD